MANEYEQRGFVVNGLPPKSLFECYQALNFLYPQKLQFLAPHLDEIEQTWTRAMSDPGLFMVLSIGDPDSPRWGSMTSFQCQPGGWTHQHLVAKGGMASTLFCGVAQLRSSSDDSSQQMWFRPDNRFPQRFFGDTLANVAAAADVTTFAYGAIHARALAAGSLPVDPIDGTWSELASLAARAVSPQFAAAEAYLNRAGRATLEDAYRAIGLSNRRRAFGCWVGDALRAAVVIHDASLGLNFSFLENRVDVFLDPDLPSETAAACATSLLAVVAHEPFPTTNWRPVTVPLRDVALLPSSITISRNYARGTLLRAGYSAWESMLTASAQRRSVA